MKSMQTKEHLNKLNRERVKRFREANPLSSSDCNKKSYLKARERILAQKKLYYKLNKEKILAYSKEYRDRKAADENN